MKRKERNRETNTSHIMMRRKKKIKVVKIRDPPLVHIEEKLDPDIQLDIFSRLPFKEAVRCRQVCKSWRILLDDNFLINNHPKTPLKLNSEYHHHSHHAHHNYSYSSSSSSRLSFISTPRTSTHEGYNDSTYDDDEEEKDVDDDDGEDTIFGVYDDDNDMCSYKESRSSFKYPSTSRIRNARTISSCNGLICLRIHTDFPKHHPTDQNLVLEHSIVIYNPITKEKLNLRTYDDESCYQREYTITCGFGYHPSTKQYKILRCSYTTPELQQPWFEIYTLGTTGGKWRQVKVHKNPNFDYHVPGVHVNGVLYWITNYFQNKKRMIISFDLGDDEEFRIITSLPPPPPHSNINRKQESALHYKLKESLGCLYLIVDYHSYIEIWLMMKKEEKRRMPEKTETMKKKYELDHRHHYSWTKVMKISTGDHIQGVYEFVGLTKSGKVLFGHNRVLTCFDPRTKRFESLSSSSSSGACRRTFVPHVNSLVSLMALQSIATTIGDQEKYLCISKLCTFSLQANATSITGKKRKKRKKRYSVEEVYEKFESFLPRTGNWC